MCKEVIIIGAGGHGKVIADIVEKSGDKVFCFLDDGIEETEIFGYPVLGKSDCCKNFKDKEVFVAVGNNFIRKKLVSELAGMRFYTAIHPDAVISRGVEIGEGSCIMAGCVINASATIGNHVIVNSGSIIEHDCVLADFVHISPGAVLCGTVTVGESTHVGAGVTVRNNTDITSETVIGVGAAVVSNIVEPGTYCGVPAKKM